MQNGSTKLRRLGALACGLVAVACGGGSTPGGPTEPPVPTYSVAATVFYDEDGNGQLDANEAARVPGVVVVIGTGTGTSAPGTGVASVTGIREGALSGGGAHGEPAGLFPGAASDPDPGARRRPRSRIPLTLPIGDNHPNLYLGLGDSITAGDGSSDGQGYGLKLQNLLGPHFGRAEVQTRGREGDSSAETAEVTRRTLRDYDPAYTLILLGTNDWHDQTCQKQGPAACFTIDSLRSIVEDVKDWRQPARARDHHPGQPAVQHRRAATPSTTRRTSASRRSPSEENVVARRPERGLQGRRQPHRPLRRRRAPERRRLPGDGPGLVQGHHPRPLGRRVRPRRASGSPSAPELASVRPRAGGRPSGAALSDKFVCRVRRESTSLS